VRKINLKISLPTYQAVVQKYKRLAVLCRLHLFFVLILCTNECALKCSWLFIMNFIIENACWHGKDKVSNFLNRLPLEILGFALAIILKVLLCNVSIFPLLDQLPWKIILYFPFLLYTFRSGSE